jgi:cytochrome P450
LPERFDPNSELSKAPSGKNRHSLSYIPFGGGARVCVGKTFAEIALRFSTAYLMYYVDLEIIDDKFKQKKIRYNSKGTAHPDVKWRKTMRH